MRRTESCQGRIESAWSFRKSPRLSIISSDSAESAESEDVDSFFSNCRLLDSELATSLLDHDVSLPTASLIASNMLEISKQILSRIPDACFELHSNGDPTENSASLQIFRGENLIVTLDMFEENYRSIVSRSNDYNELIFGLSGNLEVKYVENDKNLTPSPTLENFKIFQITSNEREGALFGDPEVLNGRARVTEKYSICLERSGFIAIELFHTIRAISSAVVLRFKTIARSENGSECAARRTYQWTSSPTEPKSCHGPPSRPITAADDAQNRRLRSLLVERLQSTHNAISTTISRRDEMTVISSTLVDAVQFRCKSLELELSNRTPEPNVLKPRDLGAVKKIAFALALYVHCGGQLSDLCTLQKVTNNSTIVMYRWKLFTSEGLEIRLHLFPSASETYIHNHRNNVMSYCFFGSYTHTIWSISDNDDGSNHQELIRLPSGHINHIGIKPGAVVSTGTFTHSPGQNYFLDKGTLHTVVATAASAVSPSFHFGTVLTLFFRASAADEASHQTRIIYRSEQTLEDDFSSAEIDMNGDEKSAILREMEAMLRASFERIMKSGDY